MYPKKPELKRTQLPWTPAVRESTKGGEQHHTFHPYSASEKATFSFLLCVLTLEAISFVQIRFNMPFLLALSFFANLYTYPIGPKSGCTESFHVQKWSVMLSKC